MKIPAYKQKCTIDNCKKLQAAKGLCPMHWSRLRYKNDVNYERPKICKKCEGKVVGHGFCTKHYSEHRKITGYTKQNRQLPSTRFADSKRYAIKLRKIEWTISREEFFKLIQQPCHYCNSDLPKCRSGLDRKNNSIGYTFENVVPCCTSCNQMKSDFFTYDEFKEFSQTDLFKRIKAHGRIKKTIL